MTPIASFGLVALDTPAPRELAEFYGAILGWEVDEASSSEEWIQLDSGGGPTIAFQLAPGHIAPIWPGDEHPQQAHLDLDVPDLDDVEAQIVALGARIVEVQPGGAKWRVYLDPAGHPFCLVKT